MDYLTSNYTTEKQVQKHIQKGDIVGFSTGSSGVFLLRIHSGYPDNEYLQHCEYKLRLGLECRGGIVCFRDLYELLDWRQDCPNEQSISLPDGYYHVTLCSNSPESGILGDDQTIDVYLQPVENFPRLAKEGVPTLCM